MGKTFLIVDVPNIAHRAHHVLRGLSHKGKPTGVLFGVLRDLHHFQVYHDTPHVVLCFDGQGSKRRELFPGYKHKEPATEVEQSDRQACRDQILALRDEHLPFLGFKNVFWQDGYEADDVVALAASVIVDAGDDAVIVSTDQDFYQLLSQNVCCWNPSTKRVTSHLSFTKEWGVAPFHWARVKSMAGCRSDRVPGVPGVGERTAAKFISGCLPRHHKVYKELAGGRHSALVARNYGLVVLPFPGADPVTLVEDAPDPDRWRVLCRKLGFGGLKDLLGERTV